MQLLGGKKGGARAPPCTPPAYGLVYIPLPIIYGLLYREIASNLCVDVTTVCRTVTAI